MLKSTLIEVWNRKWRISAKVKDQLSFLRSAATFTHAHFILLLRTAEGSEVTARGRPRRSSSEFPPTLETFLRQTGAVGGGEVAPDRENKMNIQARRAPGVWITPAGFVSLLLSIISVEEAVAPVLGALAAVLYYL